MKTDDIIKKLYELNEKIINITDNLSEDIQNLKDLEIAARTAKTVVNSLVKLALNKSDIALLDVREEKSLGLQMNTVYDIVILEDIIQRSKERFSDQLYLIEHHQNDIEIIKKANALLEDAIKDSNKITWHKPKTFNDHTLFSAAPLPSDAQNLQMFQGKIQEVKTQSDAATLNSG